MGSKYGTIIMGPAGAGKTTFCSALIQHLRANRRSCFYINLDPAAEEFVYEPDLDIKDLITLEDVMEELHLGPNGGLIYCFEFLLENMDFLTDPLEEVTEEYLIIIDMPGQIELYTHVPIVPNLIKALTRGSLNISMCAAYLLESTFIVDRAKFFSGTLSAMSSMLMLELPHVNILSKMDLVKGQVARKELKRYIDPDISLLQDAPESGLMYEYKEGVDNGDPADPQSVIKGDSYAKLNRAVGQRQLLGDLPIAAALGDHAEDLVLPWRQVWHVGVVLTHGILGQAPELAEHEAGQAGGEHGVASGHRQDRGQELIPGGGLDEVAGGPGLHRGEHVVALPAGGEHQDPQRRVGADQFPGHLDPGHGRQAVCCSKPNDDIGVPAPEGGVR